MKYFLIIIVCLTLTITAPKEAYAGGVIGATFPQQLIDNIEFVSMTIADNATAISTDLSAINDTIGEPVVTMMINLAQQQAANDIVAWANGGFEGDPLIITDPKSYFKNTGQAALKGALDDIPVESIYGDSIFGSLYEEYKDKDLKAEIEALAKSEIPSYIQSQFCTDEKLTELATSDVMDSEGNYLEEDMTARKQELYAYACEGDPEEPEQAAKLADLEEQIPDLGGLDIILFRTVARDNPYDKSKQFDALAKEEKAKEEENAKKEVYEGAAPISQTECVERAEPTRDGEEGRCLKRATLSPGESVASALEQAANSGIDRLTNLQDNGLTSLLTSLAVARLSQGLNKAFRSSQEGSGSNTGTVVTTTSPPKQDLEGDPDTKQSILTPILAQLNKYTEILTKLEATDRMYLAEVNAYEAKISEGRSCYDGLIENGFANPDDQQITSAYDFYADRQGKIDTIKNVLVPELRLIAQARAFVTDTTNKIKNSNSTQEISSLFSKYTSELNSKKYPTAQIEGTRRADYTKNKAGVESADEVRQISNYQNRCIQIQSAANTGSGYSTGGI